MWTYRWFLVSHHLNHRWFLASHHLNLSVIPGVSPLNLTNQAVNLNCCLHSSCSKQGLNQVVASVCTGAVVRHGGTSPSKGTPYQGASPTRHDFGIDSFQMVIRLSKTKSFLVFLVVFSGFCRKAVNVGSEIWSFSILRTVATLTFGWSQRTENPTTLHRKAKPGLPGVLLFRNFFLWCWQPYTFHPKT